MIILHVHQQLQFKYEFIRILQIKPKIVLKLSITTRFKIFMNVFAFLCVKNSKSEICEEISFPYADVSIFAEIQG